MPLFRKSTVNDRHVEPAPETTQSTGLFGRKTRTTTPPPATSPTRRGGLFGSKRQSSPPVAASSRRSSDSDSSSRGRGMFGMNNSHDTHISTARNRVAAAEAAEKDADRALLAARTAVKDARAQVHMLEREAEEEARRAKLKQAEVKSLSKTTKGLGRHDESHMF